LIVRFPARLLFIVSVLTLLTGCAHHQQARVQVPPPPAIEEPTSSTTSPPVARNVPPAVTPPKKATTEENDEVITLPADAKPLFTEIGMSSWYGAPYHNRRGSNGELYNMHAMTAAHRTLPLGSIVRVTNLKTNHTALVRITDRGPFVEGRILDLSYAAAKKLDVWQPGVAEVKVEVMQTPTPLSAGGRWAVQIGSFENQKQATQLADHLSHRYQTAKVNKFVSPVGNWWVRVRVLNDDRQRAESLMRETVTSEGTVYLVRLD
jgi:peptidoglycan lytic transglycosylase